MVFFWPVLDLAEDDFGVLAEEFGREDSAGRFWTAELLLFWLPAPSFEDVAGAREESCGCLGTLVLEPLDGYLFTLFEDTP